MSAPCAVRRCGYAVQFSACRSLFQERATVHFFAWQLPTVRWLLLAPLPASHFVRSLMWSISDVKHVSGYVGRTRFVRCLTCRPPRAETCADQFFCFLLAVKVQYNTCRLFPTSGRSGSQSLPCRSLRSRGNRFVQFLRRVWQLQYMSASQRGCMATASSWFVQIHHMDGVARFQTCRSQTWSLCRDAVAGICAV